MQCTFTSQYASLHYIFQLREYVYIHVYLSVYSICILLEFCLLSERTHDSCPFGIGLHNGEHNGHFWHWALLRLSLLHVLRLIFRVREYFCQKGGTCAHRKSRHHMVKWIPVKTSHVVKSSDTGNEEICLFTVHVIIAIAIATQSGFPLIWFTEMKSKCPEIYVHAICMLQIN